MCKVVLVRKGPSPFNQIHLRAEPSGGCQGCVGVVGGGGGGVAEVEVERAEGLNWILMSQL